MTTWRDLILPKLSGPAPRVPAGMHSFVRERDGAPLRLHLRVEGDGGGLLLAAASEAVRLGPAAAAATHALLSGRSAGEARAALGLPAADATAIVGRVEALLADLGRPDRRFPVFNLDDPGLPGGGPLLAPFQADVVLAPDGPPATTRRILDALWTAGIPHVRFRVDAGLPTERLREAVEHAEDVGLIAGVRVPEASDALADSVERAAEAGLDYAVVPWRAGAGRDDAAHRFLGRVHEQEACPVAEIPLLADTLPHLDDALTALREAGVTNAQAWAVVSEDASDEDALPAAALRQAAAWTEERAEDSDVRVTWVPPARRDAATPLVTQLARGPRAGSDVSILVEADGSVVPPRGPAEAAGNLLAEAWRTIWQRDPLRRFRERLAADTRCDGCPGLALCPADCPADPRGWSEP